MFASAVVSVPTWFSCFHLFSFVSFSDHTGLGKRVLSYISLSNAQRKRNEGHLTQCKEHSFFSIFFHFFLT